MQMHNVEIKVFQIGRTQSNKDAIYDWLKQIGVSDDYEIPDTLTGVETVVGHAAKRCYNSFEPSLNPNVTRVRKDWHDYFENILKSGHGSVIEHGIYTYAIEGISRVFTGELNRHRAGVAISEGSMRYIRFEDLPWWMPLSLSLDNIKDKDRLAKITATREVFNNAFKDAEGYYKELLQIWDMDNPNNPMPFSDKKKLTSLFRRIVPMGVATGGVWTFNLRALRHIIALRTSEHAEEEIAYTMSLIAKDIVQSEPNIFCDFKETESGWIPKYSKV
jgi:thymidylate synthase (FAD)